MTTSSSQKVLIIGKNGQVGRALQAHFGSSAIALDRTQLDLSRPAKLRDALMPYLERHSPRVVFLAAAYTAVDLAEKESGLAYSVNAHSPGEVARACREMHLPLVHYSTDYVFDSRAQTPPFRPWQEHDPVGPLSVYGKSKLAGEQALMDAGGRWLCFRISWVYDESGKNFFRTILKLGSERELLRVVNDQTGTPNDAAFVARASAMAIDAELASPRFESQILHLSRAGSTTWHGFAQAIFEKARAAGLPLALQSCLPISTQEYPTPAARPAYSVLDTSAFQERYSLPVDHWERGLDGVFERFVQRSRRPEDQQPQLT